MADPAHSPPLTRPSILTAHERIKPFIHLTPVLTNTTLTTLASTPQSPEALIGTPWEGKTPCSPTIRLWFKCENLQRVGAFKVRGAFHALGRLMEELGWEEGGEGEGRCVVTHSSGNHAQALSLAAQTMGIPAYIVMPSISTPAKIAATRGYGANVIFSGSTSVEREAVVEEVVKKTGAKLIPPYDHPDIILGQGTLGVEFQEQVERMMGGGGELNGNVNVNAGQEKCSSSPAISSTHNGEEKREKKEKGKGLDAIITPCGGGGMLAGTALSCQGTGILCFGAEPSYQGADDCTRAFTTDGHRIPSVSTLTIADGLRTPVGEWNWKVIYEEKMVAGMFSVTEGQILQAMRLVLERVKVVVEPSAVVGLAVALYNEEFRGMVERRAGDAGWDLGVVFSGGNVSVEVLGKLFEG